MLKEFHHEWGVEILQISSLQKVCGRLWKGIQVQNGWCRRLSVKAALEAKNRCLLVSVLVLLCHPVLNVATTGFGWISQAKGYSSDRIIEWAGENGMASVIT